jgi:hypothetical protein
MKTMDLTKLRELAGITLKEAWPEFTSDDLEVDNDFPGGTVWMYGEYPAVFFFKGDVGGERPKNLSTHFATAVSMEHDGSTQIKNSDGNWVRDPVTGKPINIPNSKWNEVTAEIKKLLNPLGKRSEHSEVPVETPASRIGMRD